MTSRTIKTPNRTGKVSRAKVKKAIRKVKEEEVKRPTQIRILAFDIEIQDWPPHSARNKFGEFSALENLIKVDFSTDKINVVDTLLHEINHAIFWAYGILDEDHEERIVATFSTAWVQVYRDNPWLLEFIKHTLED